MALRRTKTGREIPIRHNLLVNVVGIIVLLGLAMVLAISLNARRTVRSVAEARTGEKLEIIGAQMDELLSVERPLLEVARWGIEGFLDLEKPEMVEGLIESLMMQYPWMTAVGVADERGWSMAILREGGNWETRQIRPDVWGRTFRGERWTETAPAKVSFTEETDYAARTRIWYSGAVQRADEASLAPGEAPGVEQIHWTEPLELPMRARVGVAVSVAFRSPKGVQHVVGFHVLLLDVHRVTSAMGVEDGARVFMMTGDMRLLGLPRMDPPMDENVAEELLLKRPAEAGVPLVADAAAALRPHINTHRAFDFVSGDETWWGEAVSTTLAGADMDICTVVVVPEWRLLGGLRRQMLFLVAFTLVAAIVAVIWTIRLARRFSEPIEALAREGERLSRGDLTPGEPIESSLTEVRRLDVVLEEMRQSLGTLFRIRDTLQPAPGDTSGPASLEGFDVAGWGKSAHASNDAGARQAVSHQTVTVWDRIERPDKTRAVWILADATTEGLESMFLATSFRSIVHIASELDSDIGSVLTAVNGQFTADLTKGQFLTAWVGELDAKAHTLTHCSAGLRPLYYFHADCQECEAISPHTMPLGVFDGTALKPLDPIVMERGDVFAVISDGVYLLGIQEGTAINAEDVQRVLRENASLPAFEILQALRHMIQEVERTVPESVEYSMIVFKRD